MLLANGAAVDPAMDDGATSLFSSCQSGHLEVARMLLAGGAAVDQAGIGGRYSPLHEQPAEAPCGGEAAARRAGAEADLARRRQLDGPSS